jgi:hypothetical protein
MDDHKVAGVNDRKAGQNVRDLAFRRRMQSIASFLAALGLLILTIFSFPLMAVWLSFIVAVLIFTIGLIGALSYVFRGIDLWRSANRADQGAKAEEITAKILLTLTEEGWKIEYGMRLKRGLGDADVVCISPQGKAYVIDVKSHRGTIILQGDRLRRRMGQAIYPFEKDFLRQVMKQALQVKVQKKLDFVTPILAFTCAELALTEAKIRGVYVMPAEQLPLRLKSLG